MEFMTQNALSLSELSLKIKMAIEGTLTQSYCVVAEIQSINQNRSGHAYLELIEKDLSGTQIISQLRATIWASKYRLLKPYFESSTGCTLSSGIKIMAKVNVSYHILYGLSLNITDILPEYTIGEMALQRKRTIEQLKKDGVFDMNKAQKLPSLVRRIAVISSSTAAGYGDFLKHLSENSYGYKFSCELFEAFMQGQEAVPSIIGALDRVFEKASLFDCVVIIRGGGGKTDLTCFDSYELCQNICQFPLPVITGIGHDRDESIADMTAFLSLKTPTATAQFFIDRTANCALKFSQTVERINRSLQNILDRNKKRVDEIEIRYLSALKNFYPLMLSRLEKTSSRIVFLLQNNLEKKRHALEQIETKIELNSPKTILKKGYTVTKTEDGGFLMSASGVKNGQKITTYFYDGEVLSEVKEVKK
ncbi:MAG: exodeoxyribonuclease VII large subunit [Bacteroidales bacterium]|nr:exodeoxyribonuclease VII large subunit [Bacteroidales bacterium]